MDHVIPLARGGKTTKSNVVPSCRSCNQTRGHVLDVERTLAGFEGPLLEKSFFEEINQALLQMGDSAGLSLSQVYFSIRQGHGVPTQPISSEDFLTYVGQDFMQIGSPASYREPVLCLMWVKETLGVVSVLGGLPPNVRELSKRQPGFPFGWILKDAFVLIEPIEETAEALSTAHVLTAYPGESDSLKVCQYSEAIAPYVTDKTAVTSFHVLL